MTSIGAGPFAGQVRVEAGVDRARDVSREVLLASPPGALQVEPAVHDRPAFAVGRQKLSRNDSRVAHVTTHPESGSLPAPVSAKPPPLCGGDYCTAPLKCCSILPSRFSLSPVS